MQDLSSLEMSVKLLSARLGVAFRANGAIVRTVRLNYFFFTDACFGLEIVDILCQIVHQNSFLIKQLDELVSRRWRILFQV